MITELYLYCIVDKIIYTQLYLYFPYGIIAYMSKYVLAPFNPPVRRKQNRCFVGDMISRQKQAGHTTSILFLLSPVHLGSHALHRLLVC